MHRGAWSVGCGVIAGAVLWAGGGAGEGMGSSHVITYQSRNPQLPVRFEYPSDWQAEESSGTQEAYTQIQLYGPRALDDRLRTYIVVRALPPKTHGGRYATLQEMIENYRATLLPTLRVEEEQTTTLLGAPAMSLRVGGTMELPWRSPTAVAVPVQGERLFCELRGRFYELAWLATPSASAVVADAFTRLLTTLTLID